MYYTIFAKREENFLAKIDVAPLAGARIEIGREIPESMCTECRSPRGSAD